jgi:predicted dehydrogenase
MEMHMPSSNRRIGIISLGFGAQVYIPAFRSEGWEVAAICSRNRDKADAAAQAAGIRDVRHQPDGLIARAISMPSPSRRAARAS